MRNLINIIESANTETMKSFLLRKWQERAAERHSPVPSDLTGACKFAALFAQMIHGGEIQAHEFHTWLDLGGRVIDYCEDAADVQSMKNGQIHASAKDYAEAQGLDLDFEPSDLYDDSEDFRDSWDFKDSLESCHPRVQAWYEEWSSTH